MSDRKQYKREQAKPAQHYKFQDVEECPPHLKELQIRKSKIADPVQPVYSAGCIIVQDLDKEFWTLERIYGVLQGVQ